MRSLAKRLANMPQEQRDYTLATLAEHLFSAGRYERLASLFQEDSWMQVRFAGNDSTYTGFLADLDIAWRALLAQEQDCQSDRGLIATFVQQARYGLLGSSVISLASNVPPELMARLVETGAWTAQRALVLAAQMTTLPAQRANAYALLLKTERLNQAQREDAGRQGLSAALALVEERLRTQALVALAPSLEGDVLAQTLKAVLKIKNDERRAVALVSLAPQLTDPHLLDQAMATACVLPAAQKLHEPDPGPLVRGTPAEMLMAQEWALSSLIQTALWPPSGWNLSDHGPLGSALGALAQQLDHQRLEKTLNGVRQIEDEADRAQTLAALVPTLPDDIREAALAELLALADESRRVWLLAWLLPYFRATRREQAWALVMDAVQELSAQREPSPKLEDGTTWVGMPPPPAPFGIDDLVWALAVLAPRVGASHEAAAAHRVEDLFHWQNFLGRTLAPADEQETALARLLITLAPHLENHEHGQAETRAQEAAYTIQHPWYRQRALIALSPGQHDRSRAMRTIWEKIQTIKRQEHRVPALQALGPYLKDDALEQALEVTLAIEQVELRLDTLGRLALQLEGRLLERAVQAVHGIEDETARVKLFASLLPHLDREQSKLVQQRALEAAHALPTLDEDRKNSPRARALAVLAPNLPDKGRAETLNEALQAVQRIERGYGENPRLEALAALAPLLPEEQRGPALKQELDAIYDAGEPILSAKANAMLFPYLTDAERTDKGEYALDMALFGSSPYNVEILINLAPHLTKTQLAQVREELPRWFSPDDRALVLAALARHWPETGRPAMLIQALQALKEAESEQTCVKGFLTLAPHLEGKLLSNAWTIGLEIEDPAVRASVMAALAPRWGAEQRPQKLDEALKTVQAIPDAESRARALGQLAENQTEWVQARGVSLQPLLVDLVRDAANGKRHRFLECMTRLKPIWLTLTPPGTVWQVAQTIIEISWEWRWP